MSVKQNIVIEQGATFNQTSNLTDNSGNPFNTANCSVAAAIRKSYYSTNSVVMTANVANSVVTLALSANVSASINPGRYVYDCVMTRADGSVDRILEGIATVTPGVTIQ